VQREYQAKTWVVAGEPALSFSVASHLICATDLYTYALGVEKPGEMVGLHVADKSSTMQGEVIKVVGKIGDHRERLLGLTQREAMREWLQMAPADDVVVRVASGQNEYDYVASALHILVGLENAADFGLDPQQAAKALRLKPAQRAQMIKIIADIAKREQLIRNAYSTQNAPELFTNSIPKIEVMLGGKRSRPYDVERLPQEWKTHGAYWINDRFENAPVRVGVINTLDELTADFMEAMHRSMERDFGFQAEIIKERKVRVVSRSNLESAIRALQKEKFDVLIVFVQDEAEQEAGNDVIKAQTVGRGTPCLIIHESTIHKAEAMAHLIMGIYARASNVPYLLGEPLTFTDFVVGLDVFREQKKKGDDILHGVARIYRKDGALVRYKIASLPLTEGEEFSSEILAILLPKETFAKKRVVIHHDGRLRKVMLEALQVWGKEMKATVYPVEIIRRGTPRLYALTNGKVDSPPYGSTFMVNETEALVVSSETRDDATPQPIHIRTEPPLTIAQALHSVMTFTLLHYGALKTPKLPVTLHNADYLRAAMLRGIMPESLENNLPFWL
jgi:hypothetical protein